MSDADTVYFPEPREIEKHAMAFARMMFEHAAFEREFRELQDAIMREHGFGERRAISGALAKGRITSSS
jgi:hypothetical protein